VGKGALFAPCARGRRSGGRPALFAVFAARQISRVAAPIRRQVAPFNILFETAMRPIADAADEPMFYGIEVNVIDVPLKVGVVPDRVDAPQSVDVPNQQVTRPIGERDGEEECPAFKEGTSVTRHGYADRNAWARRHRVPPLAGPMAGSERAFAHPTSAVLPRDERSAFYPSCAAVAF
jgi:hypothetical protein